MRLCYLSDYSGKLDEGMRNSAFYLGKELSSYHEVMHVQVKKLYSVPLLKKIKDFNPHFFHFFHGPTIKTFLIARALKSFCPQSKVVMSATLPLLSDQTKKIAKKLKPDLIFLQSSNAKKMFESFDCNLEFLPSGVDIKRFKPVSHAQKNNLRKRYDIDINKMLVLHVGPISKWRTLQVLGEIQRNWQVVIIGSTSVKKDDASYQALLNSGCSVIVDYIPNIEELYMISDCYIFPVKEKLGCVELPLSVLEAMSCNLPVISTSFGGLTDFFEEGDGLYFADTTEEILKSLKEIENNNPNVETRKKVLTFSWSNIADKLEKTYNEIL